MNQEKGPYYIHNGKTYRLVLITNTTITVNTAKHGPRHYTQEELNVAEALLALSRAAVEFIDENNQPQASGSSKSQKFHYGTLPDEDINPDMPAGSLLEKSPNEAEIPDEIPDVIIPERAYTLRPLDDSNQMDTDGNENSELEQSTSQPTKNMPICFNCGTDETSVWRRDDDRNRICNACGTYYKVHKKKRPPSMRQDVIHTRRRKRCE